MNPVGWSQWSGSVPNERNDNSGAVCIPLYVWHARSDTPWSVKPSSAHWSPTLLLNAGPCFTSALHQCCLWRLNARDKVQPVTRRDSSKPGNLPPLLLYILCMCVCVCPCVCVCEFTRGLLPRFYQCRPTLCHLGVYKRNAVPILSRFLKNSDEF